MPKENDHRRVNVTLQRAVVPRSPAGPHMDRAAVLAYEQSFWDVRGTCEQREGVVRPLYR